MSLFTLAEVADQLRVSERTVRREIADGKLKAVSVRKAVRVREADLADYLAQAALCPSAKSATAGKFDSALAVANALSGLSLRAPVAPTRSRSSIRSAARRSTLKLVADPTP